MLPVKPSTSSFTTYESAVAATLWLMTRYQQTGCKNIAYLVEQHLAWLSKYSDDRVLAETCNKLCMMWRDTYKCTQSPTIYH